MIPVVLGAVALALLGLAGLLWRKRQGGSRNLHLDLLALALFVPLTAIFFWQPIFLSDYWMPKGGGDLNSYYYPVYRFAAESFRQGIVPLWNPYLYAGSPFAADMEVSLFNPPSLLAYYLANPFTYVTVEGLLILHYLVAAAAMYLYARTLRLGRPAAFAAGTVFAFGGFMVARLGHANILYAAAWFPFTLLFFHRALRHRSASAGVLAGAFYGMSVLGGHPQMPLYFAFFLALYWAWAVTVGGELGVNAGAGAWCRLADRARTLLYVLPVPLVGFGTSAVQLLPTLELAGLSVRASIAYPQAAEYALEPRGLITLLIPHFFGDSFSDYWGLTWSLTEVYGYAGIVTLILAGISLLARVRRSKWVAFYALAAVFFTFASMGEKSIVHGWIYAFVPLFDKVRSAGRSLLFVDIALAILAAHGLESLVRTTAGPRLRLIKSAGNWIAGATAGTLVLVSPFLALAVAATRDDDPPLFRGTLVAVGSYGWTALFLVLGAATVWLFARSRRGRHLAPPVLLILIAADLIIANGGFHPTNQDVTRGFARSEVVDFLLEQGTPFRVDTETGIADVWQPNLPLVYRFSDVMGLDKPLFYAPYREFWQSLGSRSTRMYDLLNARYLIAKKGMPLDRSKFVLAKHGAGALDVYENTTPLPRALVVPSARAVPREQVIGQLKSGDFDPTKVVLLDAADAPAPRQADSRGEILAISYPTPNEVALSSSADGPAYLLLNDVMYPGWKAYVDGQEREVRWANFIFRAVDLPAGRHDVRFVFDPWTWKVGLVISVASWLLVVAVVVREVGFPRPLGCHQG